MRLLVTAIGITALSAFLATTASAGLVRSGTTAYEKIQRAHQAINGPSRAARTQYGYLTPYAQSYGATGAYVNSKGQISLTYGPQ